LITKVVRGGSWINNNLDNFRAAFRNNNHPDNHNDNNGFRVGRVVLRQHS
jgi:formylglycine-generating enzyme required for sulfatase activity